MISRTARLSLAAGLMAALSFSLSAAPALPPFRPTPAAARAIIKPGRVQEMMNSFNLQGGDIDAVLQELQQYTGRIIIHPTALPPGTYTINIDRPIPVTDFVLALETELFENGVAVIPLGQDFLKVIPLVQAKSEAPEFIDGSTLSLPPSNRIASKLFRLRFLRAAELFQGGPSNGFQGLLTNAIGGGVVVMDKSNEVLVTDSVSNLQRIESLLAQIDQPMLDGFTTKFYQLQNGKASDVVAKLHALLQGSIASQLGTGTTYNADDRTNQIVVIADKREMSFFDDLIEKLDSASAPNTRTDVIFLQHADAQTLTTLLGTVISGQVAAEQKSNATNAPQPGQLQTIDRTNPNPAPAANLPPAAAAAIKEASTAAFSPYATVAADERSNSVVVSGTADDLRLVGDLIDKLDQALAQVRIQVIIAEVTLSDTDISGISALNLTAGQGTPANTLGATNVTGFTGSVAGWDFTNGVVNPLAFNAAFNSTTMGQTSRVHVLSAPVVVTAHNQAAEFTTSTQLPIITGVQSTTVTAGATPTQTETTAYTNVGIELNVTPLIGSNGDVQLKIDQTVDSVASETEINGNDQPVIAHREAKSYVTVKNDQMIVLGGMQQTSKSTSQGKLGFLYEIPILSQLLGSHTDDLERTELLFFIRPHIITLEEATADTQRRIQEMSNRDQTNQFLQNPAPGPDSKVQNFLDRFKGDQ